MTDDTAKIDGRKVKPLPCPFCGSNSTRVFTDLSENTHWTYCGACLAEGPCSEAEAVAVAAWNRVASRANLADAQAARIAELEADQIDFRATACGLMIRGNAVLSAFIEAD